MPTPTFPRTLNTLGPADPFGLVMQFLSFGYNPQQPALFFPIVADVGIPAGVQTIVARTDPLTLGESIRSLAAGSAEVAQPWFQMNIGVVTILMGPVAGNVEAFIASAGAARASLPAAGSATLVVLNFGTAPDFALLNSNLEVFADQNCTALARGGHSGAYATYIFQIAQWR